MIYVNPTGGLGNILFQIAATHILAIENNDSLCLLNTKKCIYDLDIDIRLATKHADIYNYIFNRFNREDNILPIFDKNQTSSTVTDDNKYKKIIYPFQYKRMIYSKDCQYVGYFQSEKYFKHKRDEVLKIFRPAPEFDDKINSYSNLFNSIGIHVRRGDYVKQHKGRMIYLDINYYKKALSLLPNDLNVLVFSDDITWCRENFIGDRFKYIDEPDYICIYLMSKMKYGVIANSTFGWWGFWLGNSEKIIAPKEWFGQGVIHKNYEYDIVPENWIKIWN